MNLSEFKAWFEGFTENLDGPPGERAWKRIKERVATIKDAPPVERHHFYNHYARPWLGQPYYAPPYLPVYGTTVCGGAVGVGFNGDPTPDRTLSQLSAANVLQGLQVSDLDTNDARDDARLGVSFDSHSAFTGLGRVEAALLSASA